MRNTIFNLARLTYKTIEENKLELNEFARELTKIKIIRRFFSNKLYRRRSIKVVVRSKENN